MSKFVASLAVAGALLSGTASAQPAKPTVVLVHGAFADSSSWNGVTRILLKDGYRVIAVANPLRSVSTDAAYVSDVVASIEGPVVLVGHSYGGQVITTAANGRDNVKSLVYVAAFAPEEGEAAADLAGKFPGGTLGQALAAPVKLADGGTDLSINQEKFHEQFAHDVSADDAA
jgi:pimeloyl-ACP methyl ester carboxylesterase